MRRKLFIPIAAAALLVLAGAVAYGAVPDGQGVIDACYPAADTTKPGGASLSVIDSEAGGACKAGDGQLTLNQQGPPGPVGPTGPAGPSDAYTASSFSVNLGPVEQTVLSLQLPPGFYALSAKVTMSNALGNVFLGCRLKTTEVLDETAVADNATTGGATAVPLEAVAALRARTTVTIDCKASGLQPLTGRSQLIAIKVGALHLQ